MRNQHTCHAFMHQIADNVQHLAHHLGVQRRGYFVKKHEFRLHGESPRYGYALLLSTGKLPRIGCNTLLHMHFGKQCMCTFRCFSL